MTTKRLGLFLTSALFAGAMALAQNADQSQTGQQNPYASGQTGQTRQITGTVVSLKPNDEITIQTSDGQKHKFSLSNRANTTVSPNVTMGSTVTVTESTGPNGERITTIAPAQGTPGAGQTGGASGTGAGS
jgi:translation initiation factor IF-1